MLESTEIPSEQPWHSGTRVTWNPMHLQSREIVFIWSELKRFQYTPGNDIEERR